MAVLCREEVTVGHSRRRKGKGERLQVVMGEEERLMAERRWQDEKKRSEE